MGWIHDRKGPCIPKIHCSFPSEKVLRAFIEEDASISSRAIDCFMVYAKDRGAIPRTNLNDFIQLIRHCEACSTKPSAAACDFSELVHEAADGESVNSLVVWLNRLGAKFGMPAFSAPMITRMKQAGEFNTPKQRALLRTLLMFVASRRGDCTYTFDQFVTGGVAKWRNTKREENGVSVDITVLSQGDRVNPDHIDLLKHEIKGCLKDLGYHHLAANRVSFFSTTTASITIDKQAGPANDPTLYRKAIMESLAIAHQLTIRWALSEGKMPHLPTIGIAAGEFTKNSRFLREVMSEDIPTEHNIRLNNFAYVCANMAHAKVVFGSTPYEHRTQGDRGGDVWIAQYFWPMHVGINPIVDEAVSGLDTLSGPSISHQLAAKLNPSSRKRYPGSELFNNIALALLSKGEYLGAADCLLYGLALNKQNPATRALMARVYLNLAMHHEDVDIFELYFNQAYCEVHVATLRFDLEAEVWHEEGLLWWSRLVYYLKHLRTKGDVPNGFCEHRIEESLARALGAFKKGFTLSSRLCRSTAWVLQLTCFKQLLESDREAILKTRMGICDTRLVYPAAARRIFLWTGVLHNEARLETGEEINRLLKGVGTLFSDHFSCVAFAPSKPTIAYSMASILWDCFPRLTVKAVRAVLHWLDLGAIHADAVKNEGTGVFSNICGVPCMQLPHHFSACVAKARNHVLAVTKDAINLPENHVLDQGVNNTKLFFYHVDEPFHKKTINGQ